MNKKKFMKCLEVTNSLAHIQNPRLLMLGQRPTERSDNKNVVSTVSTPLPSITDENCSRLLFSVYVIVWWLIVC